MKGLLRLSAYREGHGPGDRVYQSPGSFIYAILLLIFSRDIALAAEPTGKAWIDQSNHYTRLLLDIQFKHSPEQGSSEGLSQYDTQISDPRLADDIVQRQELETALRALAAARAQVIDKNVRQDLEILQKAFELQFRIDDYARQHLVTTYDPRIGISNARPVQGCPQHNLRVTSLMPGSCARRSRIYSIPMKPRPSGA